MNAPRVIRASHIVLLSLATLIHSAGAAAQQTQPSLAALRDACADDARKLCAGVQPGGGRIVACLKEHKHSLSDRCRQAAGLAANP